MPKKATRLWGVFYAILFHCARVVFWILRPRVRGTMVAIWHKGQVLLVKSSYRKGWSLPGGLAKKGETLVDAAVREAHEEVGIQLNAKDLVQIGQTSGDLGPNDTSRFFEVKVEAPVDITVDGREIIQGEFVDPKVALGRTLNTDVRNYLLKREG